ncbi:MAG: glycosyltransferase family 2 protein [Lachnospiraceae bacterium]|nr:glycosyltransferase family 2 protein [Lachnospiraceae bacterium]
MNELISIVVPVYNDEEYIEECLKSILNQTYQNLEIILVNDGSIDKSGEICENYARMDSRIKVIHQKNKGALAARNTGIEHALGKYLGFVDGDDWISSQTYQSLYEDLKLYNAELAICKKNIYDEYTGNCFSESDVLEEGYYENWRYPDIRKHLFDQIGAEAGISLNLCDKLISQKLIKENYKKINPNLRYFEDMTLGFLCILQADGIVIQNQAHYFYRQRKKSLCHSINRGYLEQVNIFYQSLRSQVEESSKELLCRLDMFLADRVIFGLNHMMGLKLRNKIPYYLPPLKKIERGERLVLYGAGEVGRSYHRILNLTYPGQVVLWVDRQFKKFQNEGLNVQGVEEMCDIPFEKVLIAIKFQNNAEKIRGDLLKIGIASEKIIWERPDTLIGD